MLTTSQIESIQAIARKAGHAILEIYRSTDLGIEKKEDASPVTKADLKAHHIIKDGLLALGEWPVLSEESIDLSYETRKNWLTYWLVDPLDGTKEFIAKNDEFTVNIALVHEGKAIFGLVSAPALDEMYWNDSHGAYKQHAKNSAENIHVSTFDPKSVRVIASRRHGQQVIDTFKQCFDNVTAIQRGSSLKFCEVACGKADIYPRVAPTSEWDTAAAQAILEAAGGSVLDLTTYQPLHYNKKELLNPYFVALGKKKEWEPYLDSLF